MWCWWQISKCLWYIGRLILATDSWSTHTNLSHCHSTTINTRQTELGKKPGLCTDRLLPDYVSYSFLFCVLFNLMVLAKNHKHCLRSHKLIINNKLIAVLPLDQLFSVHSMRMHKDHNALYYHSHTALQNWWLRLLGTYKNWFPSLVKNTKHRSYTVYLLYSLSHTITLYCTAVLVESLIFLLWNQQRWRSDVKCLAKARVCCLLKHYVISNGVVMDECEVNGEVRMLGEVKEHYRYT